MNTPSDLSFMDSMQDDIDALSARQRELAWECVCQVRTGMVREALESAKASYQSFLDRNRKLEQMMDQLKVCRAHETAITPG